MLTQERKEELIRLAETTKPTQFIRIDKYIEEARMNGEFYLATKLTHIQRERRKQK